MDSQTARQLLEKIHKDQGFTFDCKTGQFISAGFALSPYKALERTYKIDQVTEQTIISYVKTNDSTLSKVDHYLGSWLHEQTLYLDISIIVSGLSYALHLARINDQLAIFDLETFQDIPVNPITINTGVKTQ